jgi:peptide chain release factor 1
VAGFLSFQIAYRSLPLRRFAPPPRSGEGFGMTTISPHRIASLLARRDEVSAMLSTGNLAAEKFVAMSKEYAELEPVAQAATELQRLRTELDELDAMAADPEMKEMAADEARSIRETLPAAERALALALLPKDSADERSAMLEVRAGTGGDEAALFAGDLFRMYTRYAEEQGWKVELISGSAADMGGYKEVVASVTGKGVFAKLKFESGVHRVQRVPVTESGGRIHTSAATVAVLPEAEEVDVQIEDKDLRIDIYRSSGPGGQSVNTTDSAVRIVHIPSGLVVIQQDEKSQHKNKAKALRVLRTRLYELERERLHSERAGARKSMVGSGDRSERIRTYNFPQGRVTDHRINLTLHRLPEILEGQMAELVSALITADEAERLAGLDS